VPWFSSDDLQHLISAYGYWAVGAVVSLESMGIPLPGETVLALGAIYAGTHHDVNIWGVIASAAAGAIFGDNAGYWLGREFGYRLLLRCASHTGLSDSRIKLGQYLFLRHGGKVVFFGRFLAVLRTLAAFLAGVNHMRWRNFLLANATGGILWASSFGLGAYVLGKVLLELTGPLATGFLILGVILIAMAILFVRAHETELRAKAERAFPGPLPLVRRTRGRPRY
jgi:membrane protein DedA with SNARE-associated domain